MDRKVFFDAVRKLPFDGRLHDSQVQGMNAILDAWDRYAPGVDLRFIAYSLGTVFRETGATMQPIEEWGKGKGHQYGLPTGQWNKIYYGRGYVQLTWEARYAKADKELKDHGIITGDMDLVRDPELVLKLEIAAPILVFGMLEGWFTGKKLVNFFYGDTSHWYDARTIINGHDVAALVASYGMQFYHALIQAK